MTIAAATRVIEHQAGYATSQTYWKVPQELRPSGNEYEMILIEIDSGQHKFRGVRRSSSKADTTYALFMEAKQLCLTDFQTRGYDDDYPITLLDEHDSKSVFFFSRNRIGEVNGVMRVCFDSQRALPMSGSISNEYKRLHRQYLRLGEPGRFSLAQDCRYFNRYIAAIYQLAVYCSIDCYLLQVRTEHTAFYCRNFGATPLTGTSAPGGCSNLRWDIKLTPQRFFQAFGSDQSDLETLLKREGELA